jgi:predicted Rossmann fold nucleotide-binding protein DprA/Smf involved in DNA uptake
VIETTAWIRLNLTEGLGIAKKLDLVRQLDSPEEIFSLRREDIIRLGLKGDIADSLLDPISRSRHSESWKVRKTKHQGHIPFSLLSIRNAPVYP